MKLTNLDYAIQKAEKMDIFDHCDILGFVSNLPEIDPVHAANACYCKECWHYTEWGECKEFGDIMKPDEFCSRGVMKNDKTY